MSEQIVQALTAPGAPFEYASAEVNGQQLRVFKSAQQSLAKLYSCLNTHADNDLAVFNGRRLSYANAYTQAASLATILQRDFGVEKGSRIAIAMRNSPEWLVAFIAVTSLGAIAALVNSRGSADEIRYSIESTNCNVLLLDEKTKSGLKGKLSNRDSIVFDTNSTFNATSSKSGALAADNEAVLPSVECDTDDIALILFTSGTTGRPKGALLTHRGVLNALKANEFSSAIIGATIAQKMGIDLQTLAANQPQSATLLMFPLFHVSGCYSLFLANMLRGGKLIMLPRWDADIALEAIQSEKITAFPGVPTMYWDLLTNSSLSDYDTSSLVSLSVAGQATPISLLKKINAAFPNAMMGSGYGMTETNGVICMTHGEEFLNSPNSVGKVLSIADLKIQGEADTEAPTGEAGEICIRGATVMLGYDNQTEANAECFKDGWFQTGDIGYLDQEGKLFVVDRLTEMIISGGENIYCAEVERVLSQAPGVIEVTTFGLPDDRLGECLVALVKLDETSEAKQSSGQEIIDWASKSLATYKLPTELLLIKQPLERNATGKVLKDKAKELYQSIKESS